MNAPFPIPDMMPDELVVDSFAGGGGTSEGIRQAIGRDPDIAINHDALALAMHRINHPGTHHMVEDVWHVDALGMCDGRPIGLLWLSPDCKHFSKAKGGKPREKAIRGLAWVGLRWVKSLPKRQRPRILILENVEEFQFWGPLLDDGKPCPIQKGATFKAFIGGFQSLGYVAEWRELRACDYGDPTIRKRLFVILRRDKLPIVWPKRTHGNPKDAADAVLIKAGVLKPWRTAAEIIDFSLPCPSIFETSAQIKESLGLRANRPLADNTMSRVAKGTMRYVVNAVRPFIVKVNHTERGEERAREIDQPLSTLTGKRDDALVMPFVSYAQQGGAVRDITDPLHTLTPSAKDQNAIVTPFVTKFNRGATGHGVDEPLATVTSHASETHGGGAAPLGLVAPLLVRTEHGEADRNGRRRGRGDHGVDDPMPTITASNDSAVVAPILVNVANGQTTGRGPNAWSVDEPARTITSSGGQAVVAPILIGCGGRAGQSEPRAAGEPVLTQTAKADACIVTPFLVPRYAEKPGHEPRVRAVDEPVAPIVAGDNVPGSLAAVHLSRQFGASVGQGADEPAPTVTAGGDGKSALVAAFLAQHNTDRNDGIKPGRPLDEPVSTVTATGGQSNVVAAHMMNLRGSDRRDAPTDAPLNTVSAQGNHAALVAAFLAKYYGAGEPSQAADDPLHTITAKPRHGLVTVAIDGESFVITDIGMRMLTPRERFSAQGFRPDYVIDHGISEDGSRVFFTLEQQGRMCGNSVCPGMARSLVGANVAARPPARRPQRFRPIPLLEAAE
ncbi:DNA cytosine methyltransferase [Beijerinckia sp. L45]|uniref:DNA cytosine methyltransferase n=1 Tax=Beijerinckia sp. L45 TaxID=1641855 RepID=UPI001FEEC3BB|nr:DNA cytosine methyltransferase [Beijerinckia sp. L45]